MTFQNALMVLLLALPLSACTARSNTPLEWFNEATGVLEKYYYGFQLDRLQPLIQQNHDAFSLMCQQECSWQDAENQLKNLLRALDDPHTVYRTAEQSQSDQGGNTAPPTLGIRMSYLPAQKAHVLLVVQPDGPAGKAGLKRGDAFVAVNGTACTPENENLLRETIRSGKPFKATLHASQSPPKEVQLQGKVQNLMFMPQLYTAGLPRGVGLLHIPDFDVWEKTSARIHQLIKNAQDQNLNTLIVDLRDNPGGYIWEMLSGSSAFMQQVESIDSFPSKKVHLIGWEGKVRQVGKIYLPFFYKAPAAHLWKGQIIALVNQKTASAAESFAYNLQLQKRGLVIGEPTRGLLNTTTEQYDLSNGGTLVVTITRTLTAQDTPYPERVTPDVHVQDDPSALAFQRRDVMLEKALQLAAQQVR